MFKYMKNININKIISINKNSKLSSVYVGVLKMEYKCRIENKENQYLGNKYSLL